MPKTSKGHCRPARLGAKPGNGNPPNQPKSGERESPFSSSQLKGERGDGRGIRRTGPESNLSALALRRDGRENNERRESPQTPWTQLRLSSDSKLEPCVCRSAYPANAVLFGFAFVFGIYDLGLGLEEAERLTG